MTGIGARVWNRMEVSVSSSTSHTTPRGRSMGQTPHITQSNSSADTDQHAAAIEAAPALVLLDGHALYHRSFHAFPDHRSPHSPSTPLTRAVPPLGKHDAAPSRPRKEGQKERQLPVEPPADAHSCTHPRSESDCPIEQAYHTTPSSVKRPIRKWGIERMAAANGGGERRHPQR